MRPLIALSLVCLLIPGPAPRGGRTVEEGGSGPAPGPPGEACAAPSARPVGATPGEGDDHLRVRGVTISCQTWGQEWGTDGFGRELDELAELGVNWISIHPYAWIRDDGELRWRALDPAAPPDWIARPIEEARRRGMALMIKPHVGYWGSRFPWRGAIAFEDAGDTERFFAGYRRWIVEVARCARGADAFVVGTELDGLLGEEEHWRDVIRRVRAEFDGPLTYAANWDAFARVPFWDALDAVGVQAYFPLAADVAARAGEDPSRPELEKAWEPVLESLRAVHRATGKPVIFTELGYSRSLAAAVRPWEGRVEPGAGADRARALQLRCLEVGLEVCAREQAWLRGCFLWKWFVGEADGADFVLDEPAVRDVLRGEWGG